LTKAEAKAEQDRLVEKGMELRWWYGTNCEKCCGVYPKFQCELTNGMSGDVWYECPVCGKKSTKHIMPYLAWEAWNAGDFQQQQIRLEGF